MALRREGAGGEVGGGAAGFGGGGLSSMSPNRSSEVSRSSGAPASGILERPGLSSRPLMQFPKRDGSDPRDETEIALSAHGREHLKQDSHEPQLSQRSWAFYGHARA